MTADDARKLTAEARNPDLGKVEIVLALWRKAIEMAARCGDNRVRESVLPVPRTPISILVRNAAHERLKAEGFEVKYVQDGPNEYTHEASW